MSKTVQILDSCCMPLLLKFMVFLLELLRKGIRQGTVVPLTIFSRKFIASDVFIVIFIGR